MKRCARATSPLTIRRRSGPRRASRLKLSEKLVARDLSAPLGCPAGGSPQFETAAATASNGGLLKSEKHAEREGFWAAHVLRPRGAQSPGVAPECRLFPIQQTTVTDDREIPRCRRRHLRTHRRPFWGAGNFAILCRSEGASPSGAALPLHKP